MALNDNESFYRKLLGGIVGLCCLLFVVALNVMRFEQLKLNTPSVQRQLPLKNNYFVSVWFEPLEAGKTPRMVFLSGVQNKSYFASAFSFLEKDNPQYITVVNCTDKSEDELKNFLKDHDVYEENCDIEQGVLKTMLEGSDGIIVFNLDKNLNHAAAAHVAEELKLKPRLKITEIKNAGKRL